MTARLALADDVDEEPQRGTGKWVLHKMVWRWVPDQPRTDLAPHGTLGAHQRHLRHREDPCELCREAYAARERERYAAKRGGVRVKNPCGTEAAYRRHRRKLEDPCDPCRAAASAAAMDRAARKAAREQGEQVAA